jgi:hypothetical protein
VDDLIAYVQQRLLEDRRHPATYRSAERRATARRKGWHGHHPDLLDRGAYFDRQDALLSDAIDAHQAGTDPSGGERLRQLAFEAYGMYDGYREEWRPTRRQVNVIVSPLPPGSDVHTSQVPGTPRDALAELDELRKRVDRLERLFAVHVPA